MKIFLQQYLFKIVILAVPKKFKLITLSKQYLHNLYSLLIFQQGPFTDYQKKSPTDDRIDAVLYAGQQLQKKCNAAKQAAKEAKDTLRKLENMLHSR